MSMSAHDITVSADATWKYDATAIQGWETVDLDTESRVYVSASSTSTITIASWPEWQGPISDGTDARYSDQVVESGQTHKPFDRRLVPHVFSGSNLTVVVKATNSPPFPVIYDGCNVEVTNEIGDARGEFTPTYRADGVTSVPYSSDAKKVRSSYSQATSTSDFLGPFIALEDVSGVGDGSALMARYPCYLNEEDAKESEDTDLTNVASITAVFDLDGVSSPTTQRKTMYIHNRWRNVNYHSVEADAISEDEGTWGAAAGSGSADNVVARVWTAENVFYSDYGYYRASLAQSSAVTGYNVVDVSGDSIGDPDQSHEGMINVRYDRITMGFPYSQGASYPNMSSLYGDSNESNCYFRSVTFTGLGAKLVTQDAPYLVESDLSNVELMCTSTAPKASFFASCIITANGRSLDSDGLIISGSFSGDGVVDCIVKASGISTHVARISYGQTGTGKLTLRQWSSSDSAAVLRVNSSSSGELRLKSVDANRYSLPNTIQMSRQTGSGAVSIVGLTIPSGGVLENLDAGIALSSMRAAGTVILRSTVSGQVISWTDSGTGSVIGGDLALSSGEGEVDLAHDGSGNPFAIGGGVYFTSVSATTARLDTVTVGGNVDVAGGDGQKQQHLTMTSCKLDGATLTLNQSNAGSRLLLNGTHLGAGSTMVSKNSTGADYKLIVQGSLLSGTTKTTNMTVNAHSGNVKLVDVDDVNGVTFTSNTSATHTLVDGGRIRHATVDMGASSSEDAYVEIRGTILESEYGKSALLYYPRKAVPVSETDATRDTLQKVEEASQLRLTKKSASNKLTWRAVDSPGRGCRFMEIVGSTGVPARFHAEKDSMQVDLDAGYEADVGFLLQKWDPVWLDDLAGDTVGYEYPASSGTYHYMPISASGLSFVSSDATTKRGAKTNAFYLGQASTDSGASGNFIGDSLTDSALLAHSEDRLLPLVQDSPVGRDIYKASQPLHLQGWVYLGDDLNRVSFTYYRRFKTIRPGLQIKTLYKSDGSGGYTQCKRVLQYGLCIGGVDHEVNTNTLSGDAATPGDSSWGYRSIRAKLSLFHNQHYVGSQNEDGTLNDEDIGVISHSGSEMLPKMQKHIFGSSEQAAEVGDFGLFNGTSTNEIKLQFTAMEGMEPIPIKFDGDAGKHVAAGTVSGISEDLRLFRYYGDTVTRLSFIGDQVADPDALYDGSYYDGNPYAIAPLLTKFVEEENVTVGVMSRSSSTSSWTNVDERTDIFKVKSANPETLRVYLTDHYMPVGGMVAISLPDAAQYRTVDGSNVDVTYQAKEIQAMRPNEYMPSEERPFLKTFRDNIDPGGFVAEMTLIHTGGTRLLGQDTNGGVPTKGWPSDSDDLTKYSFDVVTQVFPYAIGPNDYPALTPDSRPYYYWDATGVQTKSVSYVDKNFAMSVRSKAKADANDTTLHGTEWYGLPLTVGSKVDVELNVPNVTHTEVLKSVDSNGLPLAGNELEKLLASSGAASNITKNGTITEEVAQTGRLLWNNSTKSFDNTPLQDATFTYNTTDEQNDLLEYTVDAVFTIHGIANKDGRVNSTVAEIDGRERMVSGSFQNLHHPLHDTTSSLVGNEGGLAQPMNGATAGDRNMRRKTKYYQSGSTPASDMQEFAFLMPETGDFLQKAGVAEWDVNVSTLDPRDSSNYNDLSTWGKSGTKEKKYAMVGSTTVNTVEGTGARQVDQVTRSVRFTGDATAKTHPVFVVGGMLQGKHDSSHVTISESGDDLKRQLQAHPIKVTVTLRTTRDKSALDLKYLGDVIRADARLVPLFNLTYVETAGTGVQVHSRVPSIVAAGVDGDLATFRKGTYDSVTGTYTPVGAGASTSVLRQGPLGATDDSQGTAAEVTFKAIAKVPNESTTTKPDVNFRVQMNDNTNLAFDLEMGTVVNITSPYGSLLSKRVAGTDMDVSSSSAVHHYPAGVKMGGLRKKNVTFFMSYNDNTVASNGSILFRVFPTSVNYKESTSTSNISILKKTISNVDDFYTKAEVIYSANKAQTAGGSTENTLTVKPILDSKATTTPSLTAYGKSSSVHKLSAPQDGLLDKPFALSDTDGIQLRRSLRSLDERVFVGLTFSNAPTKLSDSSQVKDTPIQFELFYTDKDTGDEIVLDSSDVVFYDGAGDAATPVSASGFSGASYTNAVLLTQANSGSGVVGAWLDLSEARTAIRALDDNVGFGGTAGTVNRVVKIAARMKEVGNTVYDVDGSTGNSEDREHRFVFATLDLQYAGDKKLLDISDTPIGSQRLGNILLRVGPEGDLHMYHDVFVGNDGNSPISGDPDGHYDDPNQTSRADKMLGDAQRVSLVGTLYATDVAPLVKEITNNSAAYSNVVEGTDVQVQLADIRFTGRPNE